VAGAEALTASLLESFGIAAPSLVALVGAGGKTTTMWSLLEEARGRGWRAAGGTTTKVGASQPRPGLPFHFERQEGDKLLGCSPEKFDEMFAAGDLDLLVVEADGAQGKVVKAPAAHEPVIPLTTSLVIAVVGADALDRVIEDVAHRPMLVAAVCGCGPYERLTIERAATLLSSASGGAKAVPEGSQFAVAITRIGERQQDNADRLAVALAERGVRSVPIPSPSPGYSPPA